MLDTSDFSEQVDQPCNRLLCLVVLHVARVGGHDFTLKSCKHSKLSISAEYSGVQPLV